MANEPSPQVVSLFSEQRYTAKVTTSGGLFYHTVMAWLVWNDTTIEPVIFYFGDPLTGLSALHLAYTEKGLTVEKIEILKYGGITSDP